MATSQTKVAAAGYFKGKDFEKCGIQFIDGRATIVANLEHTHSILRYLEGYNIWPLDVVGLKQAEIDACVEEHTSAERVKTLSQELAEAEAELAQTKLDAEQRLAVAKAHAKQEAEAAAAGQENEAAKKMQAQIDALNAERERVKKEGQDQLAAQKAESQKELEEVKRKMSGDNGGVQNNKPASGSGDSSKASSKSSGRKA